MDQDLVIIMALGVVSSSLLPFFVLYREPIQDYRNGWRPAELVIIPYVGMLCAVIVFGDLLIFVAAIVDLLITG